MKKILALCILIIFATGCSKNNLTAKESTPASAREDYASRFSIPIFL